MQLLANIPGSTLVLANPSNNYAGGTTIAWGTVQVSSASCLGSSTATITFNGGTLQATAAITCPAQSCSTRAGARSIPLRPTGRSAERISGNGGLVKSGTGTLLVSGINTFIGGVTLNSGTLTVGNDSALGSATASAVTINNGSLLNVNNHVVVVNAVTLNSGVINLGTGALIVPLANFRFIPASSTQPNERGVVGVVETGINAVHDALQEGSNLATGYWDGTNGILSSTAANDPNGYTTVGFVDNSLTEYSSWRGKSVGTSQVLISYTYYGDANLGSLRRWSQ